MTEALACADDGVYGRYVRIQLPGSEPLSLCEVKVHGIGRLHTSFMYRYVH